jgi:hypothetical protein
MIANLILMLLTAEPETTDHARERIKATCRVEATGRFGGFDTNTFDRCEYEHQRELDEVSRVRSSWANAEDKRLSAEHEAEQARQTQAAMAEHARAEAERIAAVQAVQAREESERQNRLAAMRKVCGKDFQRIRIGMSFKRLQQCNDTEFWKYESDQLGTVYETEAHMVRVANGRVTSWIAK